MEMALIGPVIVAHMAVRALMPRFSWCSMATHAVLRSAPVWPRSIDAADQTPVHTRSSLLRAGASKAGARCGPRLGRWRRLYHDFSSYPADPLDPFPSQHYLLVFSPSLQKTSQMHEKPSKVSRGQTDARPNGLRNVYLLETLSAFEAKGSLTFADILFALRSTITSSIAKIDVLMSCFMSSHSHKRKYRDIGTASLSILGRRTADFLRTWSCPNVGLASGGKRKLC